jgi:hypothetical protein
MRYRISLVRKKAASSSGFFLFSNKLEQDVQLSRLKKEGITDLERFADTTAGGGT